MTANVTDLTRVTGTIACSGVSAANPITNAVLRTALGYNTTGLCIIGASDGYYTQFGFRVDTTGGKTWSFAVDEVGDGTYTTLKTGLASGDSVVIGIIPGAFSDGTGVGARRPYAFQVTLSGADASSVINFVAVKVVPNDALRVSADLTATNAAIAAVAASVTAFTPLGSTVIATGTIDIQPAPDDSMFACSTLSGTMDLYSGVKCVITRASDGSRVYRPVDGYNTGTKTIGFAAVLPFQMVNGDTFVLFA